MGWGAWHIPTPSWVPFSPGVRGIWDFFWETTSGSISMFSASWFGTGYLFLPVLGGFVLGSCDRFSSCSLFSVYCALLVLSTERKNFMFFYVKRWITDPEVDSRLSAHVFCPLVSDSHLFGVSPSEYLIWIFWEMTSGIIPTCSALGSTVDTCMASVCEVMSSFTFFQRERELGSRGHVLVVSVNRDRSSQCKLCSRP